MIIKEVVKTLLTYMGHPDAQVNDHEENGRITINVKVQDAKELIGEKGSTLFTIQHIVRRIASKTISPEFVVDLDINNYKKLREDVMKDFALEIAERVRTQKKPIELDPMPSMDRRVIHLTLSDARDLTTESFGEGIGRYIVVRPATSV